MDFFSFNLEKLLDYDSKWCKTMGYFNPFIDPFKYHFTSKLPTLDKRAYDRYQEHNWVYDKLTIAKTQGIRCGELEELKKTKQNDIEYPIFIKPRWGHKSASSKNCYKIKDRNELNKYFILNEMMWSEFIDKTEGMTDFVMLNGKIMHQITYRYSDIQNGFSDVWKYISPENKPPIKIIQWVQTNMNGYTGCLNIQYRGDVIIEVGLRLARGGAYIISTENKALIQNINNVITNGSWDYLIDKEMYFKPFYSFKCFTNAPIIYLFPQKILDFFVNRYGVKPFYEYYFEPVGNDGIVFFQFLHGDFKEGVQLKNDFELSFSILQYIFIGLVAGITYLLITNLNYGLILLIVFLFLLMTRYLNPICINQNLYKVQKNLRNV
jgi:hypothetical protein